MLVCDGRSVGAATADEAAQSRNSAQLCQSRYEGDWTAVRPRKFHVERIGSIDSRSPAWLTRTCHKSPLPAIGSYLP